MPEVTEAEFDEYLDEIGTVEIGNWSCPASRVLKEIDSSAYYTAKNNYEANRSQ